MNRNCIQMLGIVTVSFGSILSVVALIIIMSGMISGCGDLLPKKNLDVDLGGDVKLAIVYIKGGSFQMGSLPSEKNHHPRESPVHMVELDGFWMGKYEVTQAQYHAVMGENPSEFKGDNRPVEHVSWNDAMEFCRELSQRTGKTFTLPTEAQWEYACRSGTTTRYYFGDADSNLRDYAWYRENSDIETHPVGQKIPNAWGLYDMHGNVSEWCLDWYGDYTSGTKRNPIGPFTGDERIRRGGSLYEEADFVRSASRYRYDPSSASYTVGFRVVRTVSS